jgi:heat shock protein HslJ
MLKGHEWKLETYTDLQSGQKTPLADTEIVISFDVNTFAGSAGCNNYTGRYSVDGAKLSLTPTATTRKACPPPVMAQEQSYLALLGQVAQYTVAGGTLTLAESSGAALLTYSEIKPAPLVGTLWTLTEYNNGKGGVEAALTETAVTAVFGADGKLTGSAGCNSYTADYTVTGDKLAISQATTTRKACPPPIMAQEQAYLAALQTVSTFQISGVTLNLYQVDGAKAAGYAVAKAGGQLVGTIWAWQETRLSDGSTTTVRQPKRYTIEFAPDGDMGIQADCNRANGTYQQQGSQLTLALGPTTLAACPPDSQADIFMRDLARINGFVFESDRLHLTLAADAGTLTFAPLP